VGLLKMGEMNRSDHGGAVIGGGAVMGGGGALGVCAGGSALLADAPRDRAEAEEGAAGAATRALYLAVKVATEWTLSLVLLVLTAPLIVLFAAAVKLTSPGPIFYLQTRLGLNGKTYRICKLRTMRHNCEVATGPVWAAQNDPRITPIGNVLRSTHMDELPQLWNVLCGDMSLIGPRPERPEIVARIERDVPGYRERLAIRPGVTGLAQMRLPADSDLEGVRLKLAYDLYYIRHLNPMLDARIAVCTAFYFMGAAADAICQMAVGTYGRDVEKAIGAAERSAELGRETA